MELRKTNMKDKQELARIKRLYSEAFPPEERAPFSMLKRRAKQGRGDMLSLYNNGIWCGMAYIVRYMDLAYLFYFAIDKAQRGSGFGTAALRALISEYSGFRFFLALENWREDAPNKEQRIMRRQFYLNCGMEDQHNLIKEATVIYAVMGVNGKVSPEEYKALADSYLGRFRSRILDMRMLEAPDE